MNNFVFIGDSLTYGYGVKSTESWVYKISKSLPFRNCINKGINGDTTAGMLDRFFQDVVQNNPNSIFIMGGTNDLLCCRKLSLILDNIEEMILDGLKITQNIIIGIPPYIIKEMAQDLFMPSQFYSYCEKSLPLLKEGLINLSQKYFIKYVNFYDITLMQQNNNIFLDGIHLNFLGNSLMAEEVSKVLSI